MRFALQELALFVKGLDKIEKEKIIERIEEALSEVETVSSFGDEYEDVLVAKVLEVKKHPALDKLWVVKVDLGKGGQKTVVTGAGNLKPGDLVPYTRVGGKVPVNPYPDKWDGVISKKEFKGVISEGMLNSPYELGLGNEHDRIMVFPITDTVFNFKIGESLASLLGKDEVIIEIENKALTHRGDLFSIIGMAQELGALLGLSFSPPRWWYKKGIKLDRLDDVKIAHTEKEDVWRYVLVKATLKTESTPFDIRVFLRKHGIKVHGVLAVDLTNYIMLLAGQPVHAFDLTKLKKVSGSSNLEFSVRWSKEGESLTTLDGTVRTFSDKEALLILCNNKPVAIAGVIGGEETAVDESTKEVLFEIATFKKTSVRRTVMNTGIFTDASVVFSRQQDPEKIEGVVGFLINYVDPLGWVQKYEKPSRKRHITFDLDKAEQFLDVKIDQKDITKLTALGFMLNNQKDKKITVSVPTYRFDVEIPEDIYEEIVRLKGYKEVRLNPLIITHRESRVDDKLFLASKIRSQLSTLGFIEAINYVFVSKEEYANLLIPTKNLYRIVNAVSEDVEYMRSNIFGSLIKTLVHNKVYTQRMYLFEIGSVFSKGLGTNSENVPNERLHLGMVIYDTLRKLSPNVLTRYIKKLEEVLNEKLSVAPLEKKIDDPIFTDIRDAFNPYASGVVVSDNKVVVGIIGALKHKVLYNLGLNYPVFVAEINLSPFVKKAKKEGGVMPPLRFPPVYQDVCFVTPKGVFYQQLVDKIEEAIAESDHTDISISYELFDVYHNQDGSRNLTFRFRFASFKRTLKEEEVNRIRKRIVESVCTLEGVTLKGAE